LAFGENLAYGVRVVFWPVHGVIVSFLCLKLSSPLRPRIRVNAGLHLFFRVACSFRSCFR